MLCFASYSLQKGQSNIEINLLEEVIRLPPKKRQGVLIGVNLIVNKLDDNTDTIFGILHRAVLKNFSFNPTSNWSKKDNFYTKLFSSLHESNHNSKNEYSTHLFKLIDDGNVTISDEQINATIIDTPNCIQDKLLEEENFVPIQNHPFCYSEIVLPQAKGRYLLRASAYLPSELLYKFSLDIPEGHLRCYEVYGANDVLERIKNVDL